MNEQDFLACADPWRLLQWLRPGPHHNECATLAATPRKQRLFACACLRQCWSMIDDELTRQGVAVAERLADGQASGQEVEAARADIEAADEPVTGHRALGALNDDAAFAAFEWPQVGLLLVPLATQAALLHCLMGNPFQPLSRHESDAGLLVAWDRRPDGGRQVRFLGRWLTPDVLALARAIYDSRTFEDLPVLADALTDAGCDHEPMLAHLRSTGPHAKGCWVVDALLGLDPTPIPARSWKPARLGVGQDENE